MQHQYTLNNERRALQLHSQSQAIQNEAISFSEGIIKNYCGPMNVICCFCSSKNFHAERPSDGKFTSCCRKGKVKLEIPKDETGNVLEYPDFIRELLSNPDHPNYRHFRENIRSYNSALSFASMGAKVVDFNGSGPYVFKVHGQIYHRTSHFRPASNTTPQFAQLYVIDSTQATAFRMAHPANANCIPRIMDEIDGFLRLHNRLCRTYQMLKEIEQSTMENALSLGLSQPIVNMVFRRDRHSDQRRYNTPNANEIAMVVC